MTTKERVRGILNYKNVDRMPAVYFGFWIELLQEWEEQGLITKGTAKAWDDGNDVDKELMKILGVDYNWQTVPGPKTHLHPFFDGEIVGKLPNGCLLRKNHEGVIESYKEGAQGIPGEYDYLLKDRESFEELFLPKLQCTEDRFNLAEIQAIWDKHPKDMPLGLHCGSLFGTIRNMLTVTGMSYLMADDYELLQEICDIYGDIAYKSVKGVLEYAKEKGIEFDYAHFWEDICFKNGPLLSPMMFEELTAHNYKKVVDLVNSYGINLVSLDCDGVTGALQDIWVENGVNVVFPIEIGTWGDQFVPFRQKYGKKLRGVGAMDKTTLRLDKQAVDAELARLKPIVQLGGYIPCPDHRLMPGTKMDLAKYYFEKIKEMPTYQEEK